MSQLFAHYTATELGCTHKTAGWLHRPHKNPEPGEANHFSKPIYSSLWAELHPLQRLYLRRPDRSLHVCMTPEISQYVDVHAHSVDFSLGAEFLGAHFFRVICW